jgi:glycosyltransferase involved in cell wall biosynthesis
MVSEHIESHEIHTSFLQRFPFMKTKYRHFLPLFPAAIESLDVRNFDLVISLSHCVAHGIIPGPESTHISYCFTPMRYAWDRFHDYFGKKETNSAYRMMVNLWMNRLRMWDQLAGKRVDSYLTISHNIARKIKKYYGRNAEVVYPPVDPQFFQKPGDPDDFFLIVSALTPYKNIEVAVDAFNRNGIKLVIIGTGPEMKRLQKKALDNIHFMGWQPDHVLRHYYARCRALIFPGEEDFGITPLEAQASGKPVIALNRGGVKETVTEGETGLFFDDPTPDALKKVIDDFDSFTYSYSIIRKNAENFTKEIFVDQIKQKIAKFMESA